MQIKYNVILQDCSLISDSIYKKSTSNAAPSQDSFIKTRLIFPQVSHSYRHEVIDPQITESNKNHSRNNLLQEAIDKSGRKNHITCNFDEDNIIIIDFNDDGSEVIKVDSFSNHWQVHSYDVQKWTFVDEVTHEKEFYLDIFVRGSESNLVNENIDFTPKGDLNYCNRIFQVFQTRNKQLEGILNLNNA
ncbi:hypothetical protein LJB42_001934 [Komagataella kurtzmanii]|nr:hypothetical protein LJB42_001934 [Komagataella kurtzmanii]